MYCWPTTGLVCGPVLLLSHCRASFSPPLPTCHFSGLMVPTFFQSLSFFKELSSSSCLIQSSNPTSSAHSPCLLQVLKSSSKPASPSSAAFQVLESSCLPEWTFQIFCYFLPLDSYPLCPALVNAKCGLGSSTTSWEKLPPSQTISHFSLLYHFSRHFLSSSSYDFCSPCFLIF